MREMSQAPALTAAQECSTTKGWSITISVCQQITQQRAAVDTTIEQRANQRMGSSAREHQAHRPQLSVKLLKGTKSKRGVGTKVSDKSLNWDIDR